MTNTDRIIGAALIIAALVAIWLYSTLSPYQRCRQEQMAQGESAERASSICRLMAKL
jgi:hypothetical protein